MTMETEFPDYHVWNMKKAIAEFIVPRLKIYIEKVENDEIVSLPKWIEETVDISGYEEDSIIKEWKVILSHILFPFDYEINQSKYSYLDPKYIEERKKKGLELFSIYYYNLWD